MSVVVFPGQGAQCKGMGFDLFDQFKDLVFIADQVLGYSIKDLCLHDSENNLNFTQYTQPALYTVNALFYYQYLKSHSAPSCLAGHSLGEYNALLAAGIYDFETGLRLVQERGRLMSQAENGSMLAVVRTDEQKIREILSSYQLDQVDIANFNSPSQLVLSASIDRLKEAKVILDKEEIFNIPLKVSGAFHSRQMQGLAKQFSSFLNDFEFSSLQIPIIANVTARPYEDGHVKDLLIKQITGSVQWTNTIRYLLAKGEASIKELGPGKVLTKLIADIAENAEPLELEDELLRQDSADLSKTTEVQQLNLKLSLGSEEFKNDYSVKYAYAAGSMCHGISSKELIIKMANAGLLAYFGTAGLSIERVQEAIHLIKKDLTEDKPYGMNLLYNATNPKLQQNLIDIFLANNINNIEITGFQQVTKELVKYRLKGLKENSIGKLERTNKILVKTSSPEVAKLFIRPAPKHIVEKLLAENEITAEQSLLSRKVSMADDICVEGDSGWRTSHGVTIIILPEMIKVRNDMMKEYQYQHLVRIGSAGGIGTPEAIAAVFTLGADFVVTGSINQCTLEANVSDSAKSILEKLEPHDTSYSPAGELFESGEQVQIVRKGLFFPARAQKLYDLYRLHSSFNELDINTKEQIEKYYFGQSFESVYEEIKKSHVSTQSEINLQALEKAEKNSKYKMALVFKWYFKNCTQLALQGKSEEKDNYQIFSGPALGAFNQWVKGTDLEKWKNRHVDVIANRLMQSAADLISQKSI